MSKRNAGAATLIIALALSSVPVSADDANDLYVSTVGVTGMALTTVVIGVAGSQGYRMLEETKADAALFVASGGSAEPGALLRELIERTRAKAGKNFSDLEVAEALLVGVNQ